MLALVQFIDERLAGLGDDKDEDDDEEDSAERASTKDPGVGLSF